MLLRESRAPVVEYKKQPDIVATYLIGLGLSMYCIIATKKLKTPYVDAGMVFILFCNNPCPESRLSTVADTVYKSIISKQAQDYV